MKLHVDYVYIRRNWTMRGLYLMLDRLQEMLSREADPDSERKVPLDVRMAMHAANCGRVVDIEVPA